MKPERCDSRLPGPRCEREAGHAGECYTHVELPSEAGQAFAATWDELDEAIARLDRETARSRWVRWLLYVAVAANVSAVLINMVV